MTRWQWCILYIVQGGALAGYAPHMFNGQWPGCSICRKWQWCSLIEKEMIILIPLCLTIVISNKIFLGSTKYCCFFLCLLYLQLYWYKWCIVCFMVSYVCLMTLVQDFTKECLLLPSQVQDAQLMNALAPEICLVYSQWLCIVLNSWTWT